MNAMAIRPVVIMLIPKPCSPSASNSGAISAAPEAAVTSRGDARVEHARIVAVMDACALAGLSNLSVGTLKGRPAPAGG